MPKGGLGGSGKIRKTLRNEQSFLDSSLIWEKFIDRDLDIFWDSRIVDVPMVVLDTRIKLNDYWVQTGRQTGSITTPALQSLGVYSRKTFSYGLAQFRTAFPAQVEASERVWVGLEGGAGQTGGIAAFDVRPAGLFVNSGAGAGFAVTPDISAFAPADFRTAQYHYAVKLNRSNVEFYLEGELRCIVLHACPELAVTPITSGPYYIYGSQWSPFTEMAAFIEIHNTDAAQRVFDLSPDCVRVACGDPLPPRVYRLYDAGTTNLMTTLTIAAGIETSHPVPTLGYNETIFQFKADQQCDIDIEILTQENTWEAYNIPTGATHTEDDWPANKLWSYALTNNGVLARLMVDPDAYPCTVAVAEAVLR